MKKDTIPKVDRENATCTIRENRATKTPYRHPNRESRHLNQSVYRHRSKGKRSIYLLKNIDTNIIESHNNHSYWVSHKHNIPQRIELGWLDHFTVQQFCTGLRSSYCLVSSTLTTSRTKNLAKTLHARTKTKDLSINML